MRLSKKSKDWGKVSTNMVNVRCCTNASQQKRVVKGVSEDDASLGAAVKNVSKGMPSLQPAPVKKQSLKHQHDDDDDDDDVQG